jgi:hypothetical protein
MTATSAVRPDERGTQVGRERPPRDMTWGEEGGSEMGVAHAPLASLRCCYRRTGWNTGGTERRPESWLLSDGLASTSGEG